MPLPIILKGRNMPHSGNCFCGTVKLEVTGSPEAMGYCHCSSCRSWPGGPVNAFSLWKPDAVRITAGAEPESINMMLLSPRLDKIARRIRRRLCALETSDVIETAGRLLADILELAPALPTRSSRGAK